MSEQGTFWEPPRTRGRYGNRNSAAKVELTGKPPWSSWAPSSLPARAIRWMQTFCIPRKGHGALKPLVLARQQQDWIEEVLGDTSIDAAGKTEPRGAGKSTFGGGLGTWALFDEAAVEAFGGQPQVPIVATTTDQAKRGVYGAAVSFVKMHPELEGRSIIYTAAGDRRILVPGNLDGELFIAPDDIDSLQGMDISLGIVDEWGFIKPEVWQAVVLALGKRPRGLVLGLGTRSPGNTPNALDQILERLALGPIPRFKLTDYSAKPGSDHRDPRVWREVNWAIEAGFLKEATLERDVEAMPEAVFRLYRLNQKVDSITGWLGANGPGLWRELGELGHGYEWSSTADTWVGVDVSLTRDSTAIAWTQERPDALWQLGGRVWSPGPGQAIPFDEVRAQLRELHAKHRLARVSYDPRFMASLAQDLEAEGLPMVETPQSHVRMAPYVAETYQRILTRQIAHDVPAEFSAQVLAAVPHMGETAGFTLSKRKATQHIDASIATCLAIGPAVLEPQPDLAGLFRF